MSQMHFPANAFKDIIHYSINLKFRTLSSKSGPDMDQGPVVQYLKCSITQLCPTLWPHGLQHARLQASLSIINSRSLLKLKSIELVMPSPSDGYLILCRPLLLPPSIFPASGSFPVSQFFASGSQSIGASASASVLPMNMQDWFTLGLTGLISLQSKRLLSLLQHNSSN